MSEDEARAVAHKMAIEYWPDQIGRSVAFAMAFWHELRRLQTEAVLCYDCQEPFEASEIWTHWVAEQTFIKLCHDCLAKRCPK